SLLLRQRHKRFQVTVLVRFTIALSQTILSKY
ncbi:putative 54 kDa polar flagellar sheath A domain protein, partial [Vibrio parahaemolyticus VP-48]